MQHGVARDACVIDKHVDRAKRRLHACDTCFARRQVGHIPLKSRNSCARSERLGNLLVAPVVGGNTVAGRLQRFRSGRAYAGGTPGDQCCAHGQRSAKKLVAAAAAPGVRCTAKN